LKPSIAKLTDPITGISSSATVSAKIKVRCDPRSNKARFVALGLPTIVINAVGKATVSLEEPVLLNKVVVAVGAVVSLVVAVVFLVLKSGLALELLDATELEALEQIVE
jgi:hypothetical protein